MKTILYKSLLLLITIASSIFADVVIDGNPTTYPTIQAAVDAAVDGDKLLVSTGLYLENVSITNKFILLEGGYFSPAFSSRTNDSSTTVIGTNLLGAVVYIGNSGGASLDTFDITGGNPFFTINGSGVMIDYDCICTMKNCHVYANVANFGGGISAWSNATLFIDNCIVSDNNGLFGGGGIAASVDSIVIITNNAECFLNYSSVGGGIASNGKNLTINGGSRIFNNIASLKGGGIYLENGAVCNIFGEYTYIGRGTIGNQVTNGCGGNIFAVNSDLIISGQNCRVGGGSASDSGGGIYITNCSLQLLDKAVIGHAISLSMNSAQTNGGCVWMSCSDFLAAGGAKVLSGSARELGGGIFADHSKISFTDNSVLGCDDYIYANDAMGGGGLAAISSTATFENAYIINNFAGTFGGGLIFAGTSVCSFINTTIANNIAKGIGGAIYSMMAPGDYLFDNSQIVSNTAYSSCGGIGLILANSVFRDCQINHNFASNTFGGTYFLGGNLLLQNSEINDNKTDGRYGGITVDRCPLVCEDCTFENNSSMQNTNSLNAGALLVVDCNATIKSVHKDSEFIGNSSSEGAAINIQKGKLNIFATDSNKCIFAVNNVSGFGGAVFLKNNVTSIISGNVIFDFNSAENGGAIASLTNCCLSVLPSNGVGAVMVNNSAMINGGAIYISGLTSSVDLVDVLFSENMAEGWDAGAVFGGGGGGVAVMNHAKLTTMNCTFFYNISSNLLIDGGSAILADHSIIDIRGDGVRDGFMPACQIINNNGESAYGGAVTIINNSEAYISGTIIASNSSDNGGGIYLNDSSCELVNSIVAQNFANLGDGIYMNGWLVEPQLILKNSDIVDNDGVGMDLNRGTSTVQNCVVWGNSIQVSSTTCMTAMYSNIEGGYAGVSNINENPMFYAPENLDYSLLEASPCRNIGMIIPDITNDCIGVFRPQFSGYDMGAYEFVPEPVGILWVFGLLELWIAGRNRRAYLLLRN